MRTTHRLLLALPIIALLALGCGDDRALNGAVVNSCLAACDTQLEMCPSSDRESCESICDSEGYLIPENSTCETRYLEFKSCEENATYTCAGGFAFVADECDAAEDACDAACDSPCL